MIESKVNLLSKDPSVDGEKSVKDFAEAWKQVADSSNQIMINLEKEKTIRLHKMITELD